MIHPSLLTDDEFADRKRALLLEKKKITKQLAQQDPANTEWAEIGKDSFDFGQLLRSNGKVYIPIDNINEMA